MSAWRLLVREIHLHGPVPGNVVDNHAIQDARKLGLIEHSERMRWRLTPLGLRFCDGRVECVRSPHGSGEPPRFVATWLSSLPRGVVIERSRANSKVPLHTPLT